MVGEQLPHRKELGARRERTPKTEDTKRGHEERQRAGRIIKIGRRITKLGTREMFGRDEKMMA
jgi:hypothetical protein